MPILKNNLGLIDLVRRCIEIKEINKRIEMLQSINRLLPIGYEIRIPSFITNDYISKVLYALEEKLTAAI